MHELQPTESWSSSSKGSGYPYCRLCVAMLTEFCESKQANVGCGMVVDGFARFQTLKFGISATEISEDVYF